MCRGLFRSELFFQCILLKWNKLLISIIEQIEVWLCHVCLKRDFSVPAVKKICSNSAHSEVEGKNVLHKKAKF